MESISVFDIYKIGVGPSSSHTLGPWVAALMFRQKYNHVPSQSIRVKLYGSLSKTGKGHGTDIAIMMGLLGYDPKTVDTSKIDSIIDQVKSTKTMNFNNQNIPFDFMGDIGFEDYSLPHHPNGMTLDLSSTTGDKLSETYYSIGGGFVEQIGEKKDPRSQIKLPFPIDKAKDLLQYTEQENMTISEVVFENELMFQDNQAAKKQVYAIYQTMIDCVYKGCHTSGSLPGGLNVKRRAQRIAKELLPTQEYSNPKEWINAIKISNPDFKDINKWISCFALAVNEENASFGRVVTSPTNGAAGVIPAVLLYYQCFCDFKGVRDIYQFLLTSGEIGSMFKKGATISAAVGGCQAEIGVSSAMAAGGLTELLGGSPKQVLMAAEIAMEHHLGLTCDPIGGLVQIPCIERNAMGAMKAITACNLALSSDPEDAIVTFDTVVKTMWDTAQDMNLKYKETAEGGLAFNLPVILPSC